MRILNVIPSVSLVHGGPSRAILEIERAMRDAGHQMTTLATDDDGPGRRYSAAARPMAVAGVERVYVRKMGEFYKIAPGILPWLWRNVRRFDVVHIHAVFSFTSTAAALIAWLRAVPYVVRPLGTLAAYGLSNRRRLAKRVSLALVEGPLLRRAAAVHFTSRAELDEASTLAIPMNGVVIPLGVVPSDGLQAAAGPRRAGAGRSILFLSRIDPKKNLEGLLEAFGRLAPSHGDVKLLIAGDGDAGYLDALRRRARELGIADRIEWLGHVAGAQKAEAFRSADIFVLPSFSENFGIAAAEAMAAGLPSVLSSGIAISSEAERAGAAIAVAPDSAAVADAIGRLLDDAPARRAMSEAAIAHVRLNYSCERMADQLTSLYSRIGARGAPAR